MRRRLQRVLGAVIVAGCLLSGNANAFQSTEPAAPAREVQTLRPDRVKKPPSRFVRFVMGLLDEILLPRP